MRNMRMPKEMIVAAALAMATTLVSQFGFAEIVTVSERIEVDMIIDSGQLPVAAAQGYWDARQEQPCLNDAQRAEIQQTLKTNIADLRARGILPATPDKEAGVLMSWPLRADDDVTDPGVHGISNFVDQQPAFPNLLLDYNCGARTYDISNGYNHQGTDFFTWPFGWHKMDNDDVEVVAAADGTIINKADGNYDRQCGFGGANWNAIYVQHADGSVAWYGHMKNGSLTGKGVGDDVTVGEFLGVVGSSGNSTGPHLHLEVYDNLDNLVDPWAGSCNGLNSDSWWADQRPYYDSAINALRTHSSPPSWQNCPNPAILNEQNAFNPGNLVYFTSYYRDQLRGQNSTHEIVQPNGTVWQTWGSELTTADHFAAAWWWWSWYLPADAASGSWTYCITYEGVTTSHQFTVGTATAVPTVVRSGVTLRQPEPNPFNPTTNISFALDRAGEVGLSIHDLQGRRVATLHQGNLIAGDHTVRWDGRADDGGLAASGVYLVHLRHAGQSLSQRVVLLK